MTNGEKLKEVFPYAQIEYHKATDLSVEHVTTFINDFLQYYPKWWWDAEYKEPVIRDSGDKDELNRVKDELEPTTKNDLGVDCISREQALKELKESAKHHANDSREEVLLRRDRDIIRTLPSVTPQEPRIITCKECKYYRNKGNKYSYCTKRLNVDSVTDRYREPNFYCADAVLSEVEK